MPTTVPMPYQPPIQGQDQVDAEIRNLFQQTYGNLYGVNQNIIPQYQGAAGSIISNPYAGQAFNNAQSMSLLGNMVGNWGINGGETLGGNAANVQNAAGQDLTGAYRLQGAADNSLYYGGQALGSEFGQVMPGQLSAMGSAYGQAPQLSAAGSQLVGSQMGALPQQMAGLYDLYSQGDMSQRAGGSILNQTMNSVIPTELAQANGLWNVGSYLQNMIPGVINSANDPQNAQYSRSMQQLMDLSHAQSAQSGLGGSPYAAGLADDAARNFTMDWQNNQLSRQLQGIQGAGNLSSSALGYYGASSGLQSGAMGLGLSAANDAFAGSTRDYLAGSQLPTSVLGGAASTLGSAYSGANTALGLGSDLGQMAVGGANSANAGAYSPYASLLGGMASMNQSAGGLYGLQSGLYGDALSMGQSGLNTLSAAGQLPYETLNNQNWQRLAATSALGEGLSQAVSPALSMVGSGTNYLDYGLNATNVAQAGQQQQYTQNSNAWSGIGSLLGLGQSLGMSPFGVFGGGGGGGGASGLGSLLSMFGGSGGGAGAASAGLQLADLAFI